MYSVERKIQLPLNRKLENSVRLEHVFIYLQFVFVSFKVFCMDCESINIYFFMFVGENKNSFSVYK